jgi:uncharacterized protein YndB with AHSA1/START domain
MDPGLHSGWMDAVDGVETLNFDADIREGGHISSTFRIGGGRAMRMDTRLLRLRAPSVASVCMSTSYGDNLAISSLVRLSVEPRAGCGSRLVHTETAHFHNQGDTPDHHRDFMDWWYSVAFRKVAVSHRTARVYDAISPRR